MEFEIFNNDTSARHPLEMLELFFRNRRRQLQDWDSQPPYALAAIILLLTTLELTLCRRLGSDSGLGRSLIAQFISLTALLLLIEVALSKVGSEVAEFFHKKGNFVTAITFLNVSLLPLLLLLPFSLLVASTHKFHFLYALAGFIVMLRVLANWREALEISYELSRLQSAIVLYLSSGLLVVAALLVMYVSVITTLSEFLR